MDCPVCGKKLVEKGTRRLSEVSPTGWIGGQYPTSVLVIVETDWDCVNEQCNLVRVTTNKKKTYYPEPE